MRGSTPHALLDGRSGEVVGQRDAELEQVEEGRPEELECLERDAHLEAANEAASQLGALDGELRLAAIGESEE